MKGIEVLSYISNVVLVLGGLITFFSREKIKNYFQKDLVKLQESYKRELEAYKADLLRELEEYKLGIDVRRYMSIEWADRKLKAYQQTASNLTRLASHIQNWQFISLKPEVGKAVRKDGDRMLDDFHENHIFYSQDIVSMQKEIAAIYHPLIQNLTSSNIGPTEEQVRLLSQKIGEIRKQMISELKEAKPVTN